MLREQLRLQGPGNTQTVYHQHSGMGAWGGAAVTACFCTIAMLIATLIVVVPQLHDLKAWEQIHQNHISALEAKDKAK